MDRLHSMARFDESIPDQKWVCSCAYCGNDLYEGEEVVEFDGDIYCDTDCLLYSLSYEFIYLGEE